MTPPEMTQMPVVIDGHLAGSVAGLRALAAAGLAPAAVASNRLAAGLWSRSTEARAVTPDPRRDPRRFGEALVRLAAAEGSVVPYPGTEAGIDAVLAAAATHRRITLPFPEGPTRLVRRKLELPRLASAAGVLAVPTIADGTAAQLMPRPPMLPCAIKTAEPGGTMRGTRVVRTRRQWEALLGGLPVDERLLVQPDVPGPLTSVVLVMARDGTVVERFQHLALETWPVAAGNTALARSAAPDRVLIDRAAELLRSVGYFGMAQMDFLPMRRGLALVDVNPRYYASLALALACGVNLPAAWHEVVLGHPPRRPTTYRTGVAYRWLEADIIATLRGSPERLWRRPAGRQGAMWDAGDPLSSALLAVDAVRSIVSQRASARLSDRRKEKLQDVPPAFDPSGAEPSLTATATLPGRSCDVAVRASVEG